MEKSDDKAEHSNHSLERQAVNALVNLLVMRSSTSAPSPSRRSSDSTEYHAVSLSTNAVHWQVAANLLGEDCGALAGPVAWPVGGKPEVGVQRSSDRAHWQRKTRRKSKEGLGR